MPEVTTNFKTGKRVDDPKYRKYVRSLPCEICKGFGFVQCSPTEFHHTNTDRFSQAKTSCCEGIPLCHSHHHKMRAYPGDETKFGIHNDKTAWVELFGPDTGYIKAVQSRVKSEFNYTPKR